MKKLTAIILTLTMLFAFAACGSTPDEDEIRGEQVVNTTEAPSPSEDVTDAPDTNVTADPDTNVTEPEFSLGDVEGLNYENKFIGIGCNLPSDWVFYTDEQIRELNNVVTDMAGEEYEDFMESATIVYDMFATSSDQVSNINVNLEKADPLAIAVTDLADSLEQSIPMVKQGLENMGATVTEAEVGTVMIDGEEFDCLRVTAEIYGISMNVLTFGKKCNGYMAAVSITATSEDALQEILDCFYVIK